MKKKQIIINIYGNKNNIFKLKNKSFFIMNDTINIIPSLK